MVSSNKQIGKQSPYRLRTNLKFFHPAAVPWILIGVVRSLTSRNPPLRKKTDFCDIPAGWFPILSVVKALLLKYAILISNCRNKNIDSQLKQRKISMVKKIK